MFKSKFIAILRAMIRRWEMQYYDTYNQAENEGCESVISKLSEMKKTLHEIKELAGIREI